MNGKTINPANWLGVVGAHFSTFLVKQTLGYFSVAFPVILFFWGIAFFKRIKFKTIIYTSNFILLAAIILASLFGILKSIFGESTLFEHLSGSVGDYFGEVLKRLFGGIGGVIFLITSFLILLIIAFNVKIEGLIALLQSIFTRSQGDIKRKY